MNFFATTPKGLELLLVDELKQLGAETAAEKLAGVVFTGDLSIAYKACLWSRLANRILFPLCQVPAATPEELYQGVQTIEWDEHLSPEATLHINFASSQSEITHTLFGAQKTKDAIVDQFRQKYNLRPNVARDNPDLSVHVYLYRNVATISIDLSGESLHRRGIRVEQGAAPLKENLAAAILLRAGWPAIATTQGSLIDPMCGSGTFLIEAAQMAGNIAPGLSREYFGFLGWKKHNAILWENLRREAEQQQTLDKIPTIVGYDLDPRAIKIAFANIERAGMRGKIHVEKRDLADSLPVGEIAAGLVVVNPPYGERLGEESDLQSLYEQMGAQLKQHFTGWKAAIFTGNPELGKRMGLRARKHYALFNGAIPCQLLLFAVEPQWFIDRSPEAINENRIRRAQETLDDSDAQAVQMFVNRLQKNNKHLKRWAEREAIHCYRIYDKDLPEYAVSIDRYDRHIIVKEYHAPKSIEKDKAEKRLQHVLAALPEALEVAAKDIFFQHCKTYPDTVGHLAQLQKISEDEAIYLINLRQADLEVGLPLHQRLLRSYIQSIASGRHVLNVFSRSGTLTIAAALGGAASTVSIDDAEFFLEWAEQNLINNQLSLVKNKLIQDDPLQWIIGQKNRYGLIIAELPEGAHRLREDFQDFIIQLVGLLQAEGQLILLSRDSRFKFDFDYLKKINLQDMTQQVITPDFARQQRLCQCYRVIL